MIKLFSNKTSSPKVEVESKFVVNKTTVKTDTLLTGITKDDYLFVKLTFSGLESTQKINQLLLNMICNNAYINTGVKVIKCDSVSIKDADIKALAQSFTGEEEVLEKTIIYGQGHSLNKPGEMPFNLDLTNILKGETSANPTIMIAISFPHGTSEDFGMHSPEALAEDYVVCQATMSEIVGLSGLYKYDEHDFGRCGKVNVNLATGKPIYSLDVLSSVGKKIPIKFSLYQNEDNNDGTMHFRNKVVPNFHYRFYKHDDYYVIEDPTGLKNYYKKVEYTEENKSEVLSELGIKYEVHIINGATLYQSQLDYSYIYVLEGDETVVHLYDKSDIHTYFLVNSVSAKIQSIDTPLGYVLNYTWSNARLEKISNSDGEEMLVDYTSDGYIQKVSFSSIDRYIDFTEDTTNQTLDIRTYYYKKTGTGSAQVVKEETINQVKLCFSSNKLTKVIDVATGYYLSLTTNSLNKVASVGMYNEAGTEKNYLTSYSYESKFTKVTDLENKSLYYHFDNYGRVKTIMDDKARTITYNYEELENGESRNLIGLSKTQNNSRNLIENHSFEDENAFLEDSIAWKKSGFSDSKVEIITDGVLGEKCLKLLTVSTDEASVYQSIVNAKPGNYVLKGFIKHPNVNGLSSEKVKVGIRGTYQIEETVTVRVNSSTTTTKVETVTHSFDGYATLDFSKQIWYQFETPTVVIPSGSHDIAMVVELMVDQVSTDILLDDLQLTNSDFFTRYNLIENGYMEFVNSDNRPSGWSFENLDDEDIVDTVDDDIHSEILGNKVMRIAPGNVVRGDFTNNNYKVKKMFKSIPITGLAGEQLIFSVLAKACVTSNMIFRAFIKFNYENKGTIYSQFDFDKHFDNWQMLTRAVVAEDNFTEVVVGIEYDGGVEVLLDCFQLYKDSFGKYYNYDSKGNITEVINADGTSSRVSYDDDNKIEEIYSNDGTYFKYYYDSKGRLSSVKDLNSNTVVLTYDSNDRIISTKITSKDGEVISNSTTYDDINNIETSTDEFGNIFTSSMDYLNRIVSQIDSNGLETEFSYSNKSELEKMYAVVDNVTNANSFTYDKQGNTKTIKAGNGSLYDLEYDTFGRLVSIKCNDSYLEQYQYDSLVSGYKKGQLLKKTLGVNGDYYEFEYNDLGQVIKAKLNGEDLVTYSYDENGNVYELKDEKHGVSSYFTYDLQGNLIKKMTSNEDSISYTYDNLGNIQKVIYNINSSIRSIDYEYEYELNEYTKEGYFNRLATMFGDEIVISGQGPKGQFGAKHMFATCSYSEDTDLGMSVFNFADKYDFINYQMKTFNSNRNSGIVNGKVFSKASWDSRFRYNKTFYMLVKPTGSYAKENIFSFGLLEDLEDGTRNIDIYSHLCVNANGTLGYYSTDESVIVSTNNKIILNEWNLVGIKLFKVENEHKAVITLNEELTNSFEISEKVEDINYLLISHQGNLITNTTTTTSSGATSGTTSNLTMPLNVCLMSFGAHDYQGNDFKAIYREGNKYLFKESLLKSNAIIYYNEKAYEGFDVITLNGSLESTKGLKPVKIATIDKSYRFDKTRIFKYDEELQKHVFGCYEGIVNLSSGNTSSLSYKLPLENEGTISLKFKHEESTKAINQIISLYTSENEHFGVYVNSNNQLKVKVDSSELVLTHSKTIIDNEWYTLILRYKNNKLQVYLDQLNEPLCDCDNTIDFTNKTLYLGNRFDCDAPLNGCIEMFAFKNSFATDNEVQRIFEEGNTIIVRNQLDTLGRLSKNKIIINEKEIVTEYEYDKTRVSSQTLHTGATISYTYDSTNNVTSKVTVENGVESEVKFTYDKLGRLIKEVHPDGKVEEFTYYQNGNIHYRIVTETDGVITKEEYIYDSVIKDKLVQIKNIDTDEIIQEISYSSTDVFKPISMIIDKQNKSLTWQGKRLEKIGSDIYYEYNTQGIRTKKITPNETTKFELEGSNIISMNKVTSKEDVDIDFIYDVSSKLIGLNTEEGNYFYIRDITNTIVGLVDKKGEFVVKYLYDAWGNILNKEIIEDCIASRHNPFVYKGYYLDLETNFYYLKSRYYNPEMHRFVINDNPLFMKYKELNGLNLYCYCSNNPVSRSDIEGYAWYNDLWNWIKDAAVTVGNWIKDAVISVGNWISNNVGGQIVIGAEQAISFDYFWLFENENGVGYSKSFDDGKPIHFFVNIPKNWWELWEYQVGIDLNINGWGAGISIGTENTLSLHLGTIGSLDIYANLIGRLGVKWSSIDANGSYVYSKWELNVPEIFVTAVVLYYGWAFILEVLLGLLAFGGWQYIFG